MFVMECRLMFINSINYEGVYKVKFNITIEIEEVIMGWVGAYKAIQIINEYLIVSRIV